MVIICKLFEIINSYIIILSVDCNTHLYTLTKKQKKIWMISLSAKTKGEGRSPNGGKTKFFGATEILADGVAGGSKIWPDHKKMLVWPGSSTIFYLNQKQKSYGTLKLVNSKFLKNMAAPGSFFSHLPHHSPPAKVFFDYSSQDKASEFGRWGPKGGQPCFSKISNWLTLK